MWRIKDSYSFTFHILCYSSLISGLVTLRLYFFENLHFLSYTTHCAFKLNSPTEASSIFISPFTVNLSSENIPVEAIELLDLGLSFIPTPSKIPYAHTLQFQKRITRRISLFDFFNNKPDKPAKQSTIDPFRLPSTFTPSTYHLSQPTLTSLNDICKTTANTCAGKFVSHNNQRFIKHFGKPNLTPTQHKVLNSLKNNPHIQIRPADKGGATVILSTDLYFQEALRQLTNKQYYKILPEPLYPYTAQRISDILKQMLSKGLISRSQYKYLIPDTHCNSRYFYLLPKIHKQRTSWPHPFCPPGRPIVADVHTESSKICAFIDYYLKPFANKHPSYIKDTFHFIQKIQNQPVHPDWLLFTADVESLYTNMHHDLIIQCIRDAWDLDNNPSPFYEYLLELLTLTLCNNDFEFNAQFFLQICGIAMGRKYAPATANLYLIKFDRAAMTLFYILPLLYSRFLDDIFGVWPGTYHELLQFQNFLNSLIPGIKVTFTIHTHIISFLDTYIYKQFDSFGNCTLQTGVYFKLTDTHQLLHRSSFHPSHTFLSIVRSQFIRFKRICSTFHDFQLASSILTSALIDRGYNIRSILKIKRDIWHNYTITTNSDQSTTNNHHNTKTNPNNILPVITYFDRHHARLNRQWAAIVRQNPIFASTRVISAFKRHKNLKDILTHARLNYDDHEALLSTLLAFL